MPTSKRKSWRAIWLCAAACMLAGATFFVRAAAPAPDDVTPASVGSIEGQYIAVTGPLSAEVVHGQVRTMLRSGSEIRVKSGSARIDLVEGGQITLCGPAHLSVLKSGGALTLALDTGSLHIQIEHEPNLTVYTPQIQAQPIAIGDGPQESIVGLDTGGMMCIRAIRGAVRLEQQLTGQSVLVPQNGDILLSNGQLDELRNSNVHCACEVQLAGRSSSSAPEVSRLATSDEIQQKAPEVKSRPATPPTTTSEEPIYQVFMPPLSYNPNAKVQTEFDPKTILIVRRVRVRPTLIFQGRVEEETPHVTLKSAPVGAKPASAPTIPAKPPRADSLATRARNYFRKLWPPSR